MNGIKKWHRSIEPLKINVFTTSSRGFTNRDIANESGINVAGVEQFFHQMVGLKVKHRSNRLCPRLLGIDEHRFTKRVGFATTFCNLEKHTIFDIATGRSETTLLPFLRSLKGREKVQVVCMDTTETMVLLKVFTEKRNSSREERTDLGILKIIACG